MKNISQRMICAALFALVISIDARAGERNKAAESKQPKANLKTEHNFSDLMINGKYQYPDEALVKVDDDKLLTDLIGYRKNFKDRLNRIENASGVQE